MTPDAGSPAADPAARSWVDVSPDSDFPLQNLPFGVFHHGDGRWRVGVAIGDHILDLAATAEAGLLADPNAFRTPTLDSLLESPGLAPVRRRVADLLVAGAAGADRLRQDALVAQDAVELRLPIGVGDYVDFYSSEHHATNVGRMFRPDDPPLLPNWRYLPIGYHGRSSTVVVSGTPIVRPSGQRKPPDAPPVFGPSQRLDFELEVGFVTSRHTAPGTTVSVDDAESAIGGAVLVNDWSARDLQAWEYRPLGPFLGKSFATTISPWVVTLEALEPYRVPAPPQDPPPLPYLAAGTPRGIDLHLQIELNGTVVSRTEFRSMYWTMAQQLAHATSNGTAIRSGDLYASGTVSGAAPGSFGSLLELSWNGTRPVELDSGTSRTFLEDGDTVVLRGWCGGEGGRPRIGFGECRGTIVASTTG